MPSLGVIDRYRDRLPLAADVPVVTLGEGSTPLLPAPRLSARLGCELWLKWEAANPTGSFKDRGVTVAVSRDVSALPFGGGGTPRAYGLGFTEAAQGMPRFLAAQASDRARTLASAIRIAEPAHRAEAERIVGESGGAVVTLADEEIMEW